MQVARTMITVVRSSVITVREPMEGEFEPHPLGPLIDFQVVGLGDARASSPSGLRGKEKTNPAQGSSSPVLEAG
jgi:hypothetical protein